MSNSPIDRSTANLTATGLEAVREHHEEIQGLAEADGPLAEIATALLDIEAAEADAGDGE